MISILKSTIVVCALSVLCQTALGDVFDISLDTASLVGHPAGPFYVYVEFTDGSGVGDANNTATLSNFTFGGGSALGNPLVFGGAAGSLEAGVSITDTSFVSVFGEQFAPGLQLSFTLGLTSNDDSGGTPDGVTLFLLDNSGVPIPTLAPAGDYFLTAGLGSGGTVFVEYGSDPSRAPSSGDPVSVPAPTITPESSVPEPSTLCLLGGAVFAMAVLKNRFRRSSAR